MINDEFEAYKHNFLSAEERRLNIDYDDRSECNKKIMMKQIDYAFTKEFYTRWEEEYLRCLHPALQDLYNQYQEMLILLRKETK